MLDSWHVKVSESEIKIVWLANFLFPRTRLTYQQAVASFAAFAGMTSAEAFRDVGQVQVLAWREQLTTEGWRCVRLGIVWRPCLRSSIICARSSW